MKTINKRIDDLEKILLAGKHFTKVYGRYPDGSERYLYKYKSEYNQKLVIIVGADWVEFERRVANSKHVRGYNYEKNNNKTT